MPPTDEETDEEEVDDLGDDDVTEFTKFVEIAPALTGRTSSNDLMRMLLQTDGALDSRDVRIRLLERENARLSADLTDAEAGNDELLGRVGELEVEIDVLSHDGVTGLLIARFSNPYASAVIRTALTTNAAKRILSGVSTCDMSEEELETIDMLVYVADMGRLRLINKLLGHAKGNEFLKLFASLLAKHADTTPIKHILPNGKVVLVPRHALIRWGGDEFFAICQDTPMASDNVVFGAVEEFGKTETSLPIPLSADAGSVNLAEILEAYALTWLPVTNREMHGEDLVTFLRIVAFDVADLKCELRKMRGRLWELAVMKVCEPKQYDDFFSHLAKGATLGSERLVIQYVRHTIAVMINAMRAGTEGCQDLHKIADQHIVGIVDKALEERIQECAKNARALKEIDGQDATRNLFVMLVASGQEMRLLDLLDTNQTDTSSSAG